MTIEFAGDTRVTGRSVHTKHLPPVAANKPAVSLRKRVGNSCALRSQHSKFVKIPSVTELVPRKAPG